MWTELLGRALARAGFEARVERVMTEDQLRSALDRGRWDIIFSDNRMPFFNAKAALAMVRVRDRAVPFVVASGYLTDVERAELESGGATKFIEKGDLPALVAAVRAAVAADPQMPGPD